MGCAKSGISGNVIIYSKINNTINDTRNVESALAVLAQMFVRGCSPNVHTYAFLIKGCFVEGRGDRGNKDGTEFGNLQYHFEWLFFRLECQGGYAASRKDAGKGKEA
ncbi:unnamed protein product [Malus baccata var. baccata]